MQLYNEEVNDLLSPENIKLPIHESKENGVYVCGLREEIVTSPSETLALLEQGERNRHVGSTKMNEKSSRSHTLFRMVSLRGGTLQPAPHGWASAIDGVKDMPLPFIVLLALAFSASAGH